MTPEEVGTGMSGPASPWYALAGTCTPMLWPEPTCQLGALQMVNLWFILLSEKTLGLYHVHSLVPWLIKSPLQCCLQESLTMFQLSFCGVWKLSKPKSGQLDLCSVWPHCSLLLRRLSVQQSPPGIPNGEVETGHHPPTAPPNQPQKRKLMTPPVSLSSLSSFPQPPRAKRDLPYFLFQP